MCGVSACVVSVMVDRGDVGVFVSSRSSLKLAATFLNATGTAPGSPPVHVYPTLTHHTRSYPVSPPPQGQAVALAFGRFPPLLSHLPSPSVHKPTSIIIPPSHSTISPHCHDHSDIHTQSGLREHLHARIEASHDPVLHPGRRGRRDPPQHLPSTTFCPQPPHAPRCPPELPSTGRVPFPIQEAFGGHPR